MKLWWVGGIVGVASLVACANPSREETKFPLSRACAYRGIRGCTALTEGVLLYVDGEKEQGEITIRRVAAANPGGKMQAFAGSVRKLMQSAPFAANSAAFTEVIELLEEGQQAPAPLAPVVPIVVEAPPVVEKPVVVSLPAPPPAAPPPPPPPPDRTRTHTTLPAAERFAEACDGGTFSTPGTKNACVMMRAATGPLLVTDVHSSGDCGDELFMSAGPIGNPKWFVLNRASQAFAIQGAQLFVPADVQLFVGARAPAFGALKKDGRCAVTWTGVPAPIFGDESRRDRVSAAPGDVCDPPYFWDAMTSTKKYKLECLK